MDFAKNTITIRQNIQRLYGEDGRTHLIVGTPKTKNSNREIPLLSEIVNKLKKHRTEQLKEKLFAGTSYEDNDLVFATEYGRPIDARNFQSDIDRITYKIGIERVNIHALRHAFATRSLERGISAKVVSEMLGHSGIQITLDIYSHAP